MKFEIGDKIKWCGDGDDEDSIWTVDGYDSYGKVFLAEQSEKFILGERPSYVVGNFRKLTPLELAML